MSHYSPIVAALATMLLTTIILFSKYSKSMQDVPNERSLHEEPIPRFGGIALMAGILSGWALMLTSLKWWLVLPLAGVFIISLMDDVHNLSVPKRLLAQVSAAVVAVLGSGIAASHGWWLAPVLLLYIVWMANLYNFMDGSDGLAGGMTLCGFSMYGVAALMAHDDTLAMMSFTVGAAALGFLYFNSAPAKVFMGDGGSIPLGFIAAVLGMWGWMEGHWSVWFPLLVFSPFIMDATVTLIKRTIRREKITQAHRDHYFQRLIRMGWSHKRLAYTEYAVMVCAGVSALAFVHDPFPLPLLLVWGAVYLVLMVAIDIAWNKSEVARNV